MIEITKFYAEPGMMITDSETKETFYFDGNGEYVCTNKKRTRKLKLHYKYDETLMFTYEQLIGKLNAPTKVENNDIEITNAPSTTEKKLTCKKCGESFTNRGVFLAHSRTHGRDK